MDNTNKHFEAYNLSQSINIANSLIDSIVNSQKESCNSLLSSCGSQIEELGSQLIKSLSCNINSSLKMTLDNLNLNILNIINNGMLDTPVNTCDDLIESIKDFSDTIESKTIDASNIDINDKSKLDQDIKSIKSNLDLNKNIDWKFLIPLILSLISILIQISGTIDSNNSSKSTIEFQTGVNTSLEKINNCLEKNLSNYSQK